MKLPKVQSNKTQKFILWISILLSITLLLLSFITTGGQTKWAYIECPTDAYEPCKNALYDCANPPPPGTPLGRDNLCADQKKGEKICSEFPKLCTERTLQQGTSLGEKPPITIQYLREIIAAILLLGGIGYYTAKDKK